MTDEHAAQMVLMDATSWGVVGVTALLLLLALGAWLLGRRGGMTGDPRRLR